MESRASADNGMLEVKCKAVIQITVSSHLKKAVFHMPVGKNRDKSFVGADQTLKITE